MKQKRQYTKEVFKVVAAENTGMMCRVIKNKKKGRKFDVIEVYIKCMKKILCWLGLHNLSVDTQAFKATCRNCRWLFDVTYDMYYGETVIKRKVDCGEFNCCVDDTYGFVPEAGCPKHD